MLVLTRSSNAGVQIGDDIEVVVLEIKGDTVKLGFSAPRSVRILRSEIAEQSHLKTRTQRSAPHHLTTSHFPRRQHHEHHNNRRSLRNNDSTDSAINPVDHMALVHHIVNRVARASRHSSNETISFRRE